MLNNNDLFLPPLSFSAPCTPQDVDVISQCTDGSLVVSWSQNPNAHYFQVIAASDAGARHHCNVSGTACSIENLPCGQNYNVTVVSVRDGCESKPSSTVETSSGKYSPGELLLYTRKTEHSCRKLTVGYNCFMMHVVMVYLSKLRVCPQMPMDTWTVCQTLPG